MTSTSSPNLSVHLTSVPLCSTPAGDVSVGFQVASSLSFITLRYML